MNANAVDVAVPKVIVQVWIDKCALTNCTAAVDMRGCPCLDSCSNFRLFASSGFGRTHLLLLTCPRDTTG